MSWQATAWAKKMILCPNGQKITRSEKFLLMMLSECHNAHTRLTDAAVSQLAEDTLTSERHVYSLLQSLQTKQVILIRSGRSSGQINTYILLDQGLKPVQTPGSEASSDRGLKPVQTPHEVDNSVDNSQKIRRGLKPLHTGYEVRVQTGSELASSDPIHTQNTLFREKEILRAGAGAPGSVDNSRINTQSSADLETLNLEPGTLSHNAGERHGDLGETHNLHLAGSTPAPASKAGHKLSPDLKAAADRLYKRDPARFSKLIRWIWKQQKDGHAEEDIIGALASLQGREESFGQVDNWWAYLEGENGTGQSMIERVRSRRLQGEAETHKKPGPVKIGDLVELAKLASARKQ